MISPLTANSQQQIDKQFMRRALELADEAYKLGEIPVGAVVVQNDKVIGEGYNRCVIDTDPSAHAELVALRKAAKRQQDFRLDGATLYVTLEPCLMCCGAMLQARIFRLVFGARESKTGGVVSIHESLRLPGIEHHVAITEGVSATDSADMLRSFFHARR